MSACGSAPSTLEEVPALSLPLEFSKETYKSHVTQKPNTAPEWLEKWGFDPATSGRMFTLGKPGLETSCEQVILAQETGGELRIWLVVLKADLTQKTTIELYYEDMVDDLFSAVSTIDAEGKILIREESMKFDAEGNIVPNSNTINLDLKAMCGV